MYFKTTAEGSDTATVMVANTDQLAAQLAAMPPGYYSIRWGVRQHPLEDYDVSFPVTVLSLEEAGDMAALETDVRERIDLGIGRALQRAVVDYLPLEADLTWYLLDVLKWGQWVNARHLAAGIYWNLGRDIDSIVGACSDWRTWEPKQWLIALAAMRATRCPCCGDVPRPISEAAYMSCVCLANLPIGD